MDYALVKAVHVGSVVLSGVLFVLRGVWLAAGSRLATARWARVVPHVNDTVLLAAAIWLAVNLGQAPGRDAWLTAKVAGLLAYIALGFLAMKPWLPARGRVAAWVAALAVFGYIAAVALTKRVMPWT
jgi:uncharacterized membrane protein SirB2